jgi:hypothetical protein
MLFAGVGGGKFDETVSLKIESERIMERQTR